MSKLPVIAPIEAFEGQKIDLQYYLDRDYVDVSEASLEIPSAMECLNELRAWYQEERDALKAKLAEAEANAYFDLKGAGDGSFALNYQAKPTEDGIKMAIILDPDVRKLKADVGKYHAMVGRLTGSLQSLQAKVDLTRSSEATRRSTFKETTPEDRDR